MMVYKNFLYLSERTTIEMLSIFSDLFRFITLRINQAHT
jgi:hypothetical protein